MKNTFRKGFSLVELLVVITILAIISVVAYTSFSWSTDKAKNSRRINDLASMETALQAFYTDKNYYPMPSAYDASNNVFWYDSAATATYNNILDVDKAWDQVSAIKSNTKWWWKVYNIDPVATASQIWAKWVIDSSVLPKQYLSQDLYDPSLKDIKVWDTKTFKDFWIWKYVYGIYQKNWTFAVWSQKWSAYNIAATLTDEQKSFVAKVIWNFDEKTCFKCPKSLIWPWIDSADNVVIEWNDNSDWTSATAKIPYQIAWF